MESRGGEDDGAWRRRGARTATRAGEHGEQAHSRKALLGRDYEIIDRIGRGSFGEVFVVKSRALPTHQNMGVIKKIELKKLSKEEVDDVVSEVTVMSKISHPNIVRFFESFMTENNTVMHIAMEFVEGGDLDELVKDMHKTPSATDTQYAEEVAWTVVSDIGEALSYLHAKTILHRDIKPQNILVKRGPFGGKVFKLADMGFSKILAPERLLATSRVGTPLYMAPEMFSGNAYNAAVDMWALGCVLYQTCTSTTPFQAKSQGQLEGKIMRQRAPELPASFSVELQFLISLMLHKIPKKRPTADQTLLYPATLVRKELRDLRRVRKELSSEVAAMREDSSLSTSQVASLQEQCSALQQERSVMDTKCANLTAENDSLRQELRAMVRASDVAQSRHAGVAVEDGGTESSIAADRAMGIGPSRALSHTTHAGAFHHQQRQQPQVGTHDSAQQRMQHFPRYGDAAEVPSGSMMRDLSPYNQQHHHSLRQQLPDGIKNDDRGRDGASRSALWLRNGSSATEERSRRDHNLRMLKEEQRRLEEIMLGKHQQTELILDHVAALEREGTVNGPSNAHTRTHHSPPRGYDIGHSPIQHRSNDDIDDDIDASDDDNSSGHVSRRSSLPSTASSGASFLSERSSYHAADVADLVYGAELVGEVMGEATGARGSISREHVPTSASFLSSIYSTDEDGERANSKRCWDDHGGDQDDADEVAYSRSDAEALFSSSNSNNNGRGSAAEWQDRAEATLDRHTGSASYSNDGNDGDAGRGSSYRRGSGDNSFNNVLFGWTSAPATLEEHQGLLRRARQRTHDPEWPQNVETSSHEHGNVTAPLTRPGGTRPAPRSRSVLLPQSRTSALPLSPSSLLLPASSPRTRKTSTALFSPVRGLPSQGQTPHATRGAIEARRAPAPAHDVQDDLQDGPEVPMFERTKKLRPLSFSPLRRRGQGNPPHPVSVYVDPSNHKHTSESTTPTSTLTSTVANDAITSASLNDDATVEALHAATTRLLLLSPSQQGVPEYARGSKISPSLQDYQQRYHNYLRRSQSQAHAYDNGARSVKASPVAGIKDQARGSFRGSNDELGDWQASRNLGKVGNVKQPRAPLQHQRENQNKGTLPARHFLSSNAYRVSSSSSTAASTNALLRDSSW